jgi:hypothetical protein
MLIFGVLLLVTTIFAIKIVVTEIGEQPDKPPSLGQGSTFEEPLDSGIGSKGTYKYIW